jgi:hypothetical protein
MALSTFTIIFNKSVSPSPIRNSNTGYLSIGVSFKSNQLLFKVGIAFPSGVLADCLSRVTPLR